MDRSKLIAAFQQANAVVTTHGIMNYMPERYKKLATHVNEQNDGCHYEFYLDPKRSHYDDDNFCCTLCVVYTSQENKQVDGGIYRDYARRIYLRYGSTDVTIKSLQLREKFISSIMMVAEILESIMPESITCTVESPEQHKDRLQREHEQYIGWRIYHAVGKDNLKNLRKAGKSRCVRIPETYITDYGEMPACGSYRYNHVLRTDRRRRVKEEANYLFRVMLDGQGSHYVNIYKLN
jgi:hypothetical protein